MSEFKKVLGEPVQRNDRCDEMCLALTGFPICANECPDGLVINAVASLEVGVRYLLDSCVKETANVIVSFTDNPMEPDQKCPLLRSQIKNLPPIGSDPKEWSPEQVVAVAVIEEVAVAVSKRVCKNLQWEISESE